jgi:hypothetical protein
VLVCWVYELVDEHTARAGWVDDSGARHAKEFRSEREAVRHLARERAAGWSFTASVTRLRRGSWTTACR